MSWDSASGHRYRQLWDVFIKITSAQTAMAFGVMNSNHRRIYDYLYIRVIFFVYLSMTRLSWYTNSPPILLTNLLGGERESERRVEMGLN
jgi:hypothetical protein